MPPRFPPGSCQGYFEKEWGGHRVRLQPQHGWWLGLVPDFSKTKAIRHQGLSCGCPEGAPRDPARCPRVVGVALWPGPKEDTCCSCLLLEGLRVGGSSASPECADSQEEGWGVTTLKLPPCVCDKGSLRAVLTLRRCSTNSSNSPQHPAGLPPGLRKM